MPRQRKYRKGMRVTYHLGSKFFNLKFGTIVYVTEERDYHIFVIWDDQLSNRTNGLERDVANRILLIVGDQSA